RHHQGPRRYLGRRRQCRCTAGSVGRAGRYLRQPGRARPGTRQARFRLRGPRRAAGQEHHAPGPRIRCQDRPGISNIGTGAAGAGGAAIARQAVDCGVANMSGDPEQEYFADGMVEDIITGLSRIKWLFVIARNSSFAYKGKVIDIKQLGRELGVRYVLEGSLRKGGTRLRITGQLIEAETGTHVWADKYDGVLEDVFDLQDKITETIVGIIEPSVRRAETERTRRKRPENP